MPSQELPGPAAAGISVVIPTIGREQLRAAVDSALAQTLPPLEVLVVDDRGPGRDLTGVDGLPGVRVLHTAGRTGPAAARSLGVEAAQGELVAFLDDDDTWAPGKLALQEQRWREEAGRGRAAVVTCRSTNIDADGTVTSVVPERPPGPDEPLATYLFRRTTLRPLGGACGASSLLVPAAVLRAVPLDPSLTLHEDWDWVLRASRHPGVVISTVFEPLVTYREVSSGPKASQPADGWRRSSAWVARAGLPARERGDLLLTVTAPLALAAGQRRRALQIALSALVSARPGLPAVAGLLLQLAVPAWVLRAAGAAVGRRTARRGSDHDDPVVP